MPRVVLINSYRMAEAQRLVEEGTYPAQHLWGTHYLPANWRVATTSLSLNHIAEKHTWLSRLTRAVERAIGDPLQSIWAISGKNRKAVVYAANPKTGTLIGMMKYARLLSAPYIVLVHSWPISSWAKRWLRAADHIMVFSDQLREQVIDDGFATESVSVIHWGPDLEWPPYATPVERRDLDFFAAGKTNRSYDGLREAAAESGWAGVIQDGQSVRTYTNGNWRETQKRPAYDETIASMARAQRVVIPLEDRRMLSGLTELCDAIALQVPVLMSANSWSPIDVELEGIGHWLPDNSTATIVSMMESPTGEVANFQGVRDRFNARRHSAELNEILEKVIGRA
ncbi:hypothetical protein PUY80_15155 [Plantibacter flavus]|uniref:hypothetical protein n=1 Tax=Plantibacter flavus TaxID=150123 RepID=UPI002378FDA3|nr:hypothetical protein [Plantibacter flavus]MDD9153907.1 hypothetical protein [Plantibacter flavus]